MKDISRTRPNRPGEKITPKQKQKTNEKIDARTQMQRAPDTQTNRQRDWRNEIEGYDVEKEHKIRAPSQPKQTYQPP